MSTNLNCPTITLPLLIAYTEALLPSLLKATKQETADTNATTSDKQSIKLLWAVEDSDEAATLAKQLDQQLQKQAKHKISSPTNTEPSLEANTATDIEISTLAQLNNQYIRQRYELGCFWLPTISAEQLQHFIPTIMRYRDLYAAHLLIAISDSLDLRAYGFTPFDIINDRPLDITKQIADSNASSDAILSNLSLTLWQFNLYDYKRLPDWLNSKYWANPENWDKHRW